MKKPVFHFMLALGLALSALSMSASALDYGILRPRSTVDSTGVPSLSGIPPRDPNASGSVGGGLGNRMGYFSVGPAQSGYVRASTCILSQVSGNTNRNTSYVRPIGGPYGDGTYVWMIGSSGGVEDPTSATCYFNGTAGVFNSPSFPNYDNNSVGPVTNEFSGYYIRTYQDYYHLDFLRGESQYAGRTYLTDYTYAPCTVDPASAACAATNPAPICPAPTYFNPSYGACIDPNANNQG